MTTLAEATLALVFFMCPADLVQPTEDQLWNSCDRFVVTHDSVVTPTGNSEVIDTDDDGVPDTYTGNAADPDLNIGLTSGMCQMQYQQIAVAFLRSLEQNGTLSSKQLVPEPFDSYLQSHRVTKARCMSSDNVGDTA
jgi:hypothetical protein